MKILVACPGSFTHGLDSPERGEGRWAQNFARLLGKAGHDVFAYSGGTVILGEGRPSSVKLIPPNEINKHGPYDIYFTGAWFPGRRELAVAKKYIHLDWWPEERHLKVYSVDNHYLAYYLQPMGSMFLDEKYNANIDRTFFLPAPFGETMAEPAFDNNGLLWCNRIGVPGKYSQGNYKYAKILVGILGEVLAAYPYLVLDRLYKDFSGDLRFPTSRAHGLLPYNKVIDIIQRTKLSLPIRMQSCIFDCTLAGVPTLLWEDTALPGQCFIDTARKHGVLVEKGANKDRLKEVIVTLLTNKEVYINYTKDLQHLFRHHTEDAVLSYFHHIVNSVC